MKFYNVDIKLLAKFISCSKSPIIHARQFHRRACLSAAKKLPEGWNSKRINLLRTNYIQVMAQNGDAAALALEPLRKSVKEQGEDA